MKQEVIDKYKGNIWKIFTLYGLASLSLFYVPVLIFYFQYFNISYFKISLLISAGLISTLIFEVPTGAFADLYGRKKSIIAGIFGFFVSALIFILANNFLLFFISGIIGGIGQAFLSGAWEAFLFDSLKKIKREKEYLKLTGHQQSVFYLLLIISSFISPFLFTKNIRIPFYIGLFFSFFLFIFSFTLFEPEFKQKKFSYREHAKQMKEGFSYLLNHDKLIWLALFSLIPFSVDKVFGNLISTPYIVYKGFELEVMGFVFGFLILFQAISMNFSHYFEKKFKETPSIIISFTGWVLFYILMYSTKKYLFAIFSGISGGFMSINMLVLHNAFNNHLKKKIRATVHSINSMVNSLVSTLFILVGGLLIDNKGLNFTVGSLIVFSIISGMILIIKKKN